MVIKDNQFSLKKMIFAIFLSIVIFGLFSIIYSLFIYFGNFEFNKWIPFMIGLCSFFILGFLCANFMTKKGFFWGLLNGFLFILIILIIRKFQVPNWYYIIKYIAYLLISGTGGIIGVSFKPIIK